MEFPPEHYFQTATQRIRQAQHLYEEGASFALAIYVGGLAVECLLRAYKGRRDPTFDERHDLARLFKASGMLDIDHDKLRAKHWTDEQIESHLAALRVGANIIFQMWSNTYRFASKERLRSHLKKSTGYRRIKGDYLKEQARQFLNAAQSFMNKGVGRTMASVKSPLQRKLEKLLAQKFPPPAAIRLEDADGIIGVITSAKFAGMETIDRQALIGDILATHLKPEERRRVQLIVAVTPDEGTGYLAGPE